MVLVIAYGSDKAAGVGAVALKIEVAEKLHKLLFSDSDWNRIVRAGLFALGSWFHTNRDPLRFGEFSRTDLGYDRKQGLSDKGLLAAALADGTMQKLADQFFHGFNPWRLSKVPGPLWQQWLNEGRKTGRYNISVTGTFSTAKRDLRTYVKRQLKAELYAKSQDVPEKFQTPLVHSGELRETVLDHARITARATASSQQVTISRDDPHGQSHPIVGAVMRRVTQAELTQGAEVLGQTIDALINGASEHTVARGPSAGQIRKSLTADQRESIAHTLTNQHGGARAVFQ